MQQDIRQKEAGIWYFATSSCNHALMNKILARITSQKINAEKWTATCQSKIGLIFMGGLSDYEDVISFLQLQIKGRGHRACVLNLAPDIFESAYKLKILKYGAEYFFERSYLTEPFDFVVERLNRWMTIERLLHSPIIKKRIAGKSIATMFMLRSIIEVAFYSRNNVLILGERGVGKEQIAHIIHELDSRKEKGDLVIFDCSTLKRELSGSELFGHERGSFTGADYSRDGAVALAHKGSFFLDEITELPLNLQAEFLRVVQEGTYKKVGSNSWRYTQFRLISATNRNLNQAVEEGQFRSDLFDRIATTIIYAPSLNDRREDIPAIIDFCLKDFFGEKIPVVEKEVYDVLYYRNYAGNIRELKNILSNVCLRYSGQGPITLGDLPDLNVESPASSAQAKWYERNELIELMNQAIDEGYELKKIEEIVQSIATKITLHRVRKNKEASKILGKSERWIQMQKTKEKNSE
jgi:transcriptional regulator with GAF, ATPase, and Fis domain